MSNRFLQCVLVIHSYYITEFTYWVRNDSHSTIYSINSDLDRLVSWASANGLYIYPSKSKCIMISRTNISFVIPGLSIKSNKIDFVSSATNLDFVFTGRLSWSSDISVIVGKIYSLLWNLWVVMNSTPFAIRMQLAKTYLIPVPLYANCNSHDNQKHNLAYNNTRIARYVFLKGRCNHISHSAYQIFGVKFDNLIRNIY